MDNKLVLTLAKSNRFTVASLALSACVAGATFVTAQRFDCVLENGTDVRFRVDPNLFVDAVSAEEPIRRKVTSIEMGAAKFPGEPFAIGDLRGFSAESLGGGTLLMVVDASGSARMSERQAGILLSGECEVQP